MVTPNPKIIIINDSTVEIDGVQYIKILRPKKGMYFECTSGDSSFAYCTDVLLMITDNFCYNISRNESVDIGDLLPEISTYFREVTPEEVTDLL